MVIMTGFTNAQEVIATQGDSYSNASGTIDFTIGEVVINTVSDGSHDLTQGFHQTIWSFADLVDHSPDFDLTVYPNPVSDALIIESSNYQNVMYSLFDVQGRKILEGRLDSEASTINVGHCAPGAYSLSLTRQGEQLKAFKLLIQQ